MTKVEFEENLNNARQKNAIEYSIREKFIDEYVELIDSWHNYKKDMATQEIYKIKISELYSLFWGLLSISLNNNTEVENNGYHMLKLCLMTLSTLLANNVQSIIKLSCGGYDFQAGILIRNTYELSFTLLAIMLDEKKCEAYYKSANDEDDYDVWKRNFNIKELNNTLEKFENTIDADNNLSFLINWRKENYKFYSKFIHNSMITCYSNIFNQVKDEVELMNINIWGNFATRIENTLNALNELMFFTSTTFYKIISCGIVAKEQLVKDDNDEHDLWNEVTLINLMGGYLYTK